MGIFGLHLNKSRKTTKHRRGRKAVPGYLFVGAERIRHEMRLREETDEEVARKQSVTSFC